MLIAAIAAAAFCATYAGGLLALRLRDRLHLVLGFSAGAVVGVAFFDLMPESLALGEPFHTAANLLLWTAIGFMIYLVLDRARFYFDHRAPRPDAHAHHPAQSGALGAASLSAHSLLDGVAIGVAFQASASVGAVVTMAVLAHDFSDGINTASMVLKKGGTRPQALRWLLTDALAPAVGIGSTYLFTVPQQALGVALALFSGFFLYIGASDLIPESHHAHPKLHTTVMTMLGAAVIYLAVALVSR
jgi:ZIP family zinc transporter